MSSRFVKLGSVFMLLSAIALQAHAVVLEGRPEVRGSKGKGEPGKVKVYEGVGRGSEVIKDPAVRGRELQEKLGNGSAVVGEPSGRAKTATTVDTLNAAATKPVTSVPSRKGSTKTALALSAILASAGVEAAANAGGSVKASAPMTPMERVVMTEITSLQAKGELTKEAAEAAKQDLANLSGTDSIGESFANVCGKDLTATQLTNFLKIQGEAARTFKSTHSEDAAFEAGVKTHHDLIGAKILPDGTEADSANVLCAVVVDSYTSIGSNGLCNYGGKNCLICDVCKKRMLPNAQVAKTLLDNAS